jgi:chromosome segregation ATPase
MNQNPYNLKDSLETENYSSSVRNSVLSRDPELLNRFRSDIEVKFSELRTKNATLETNFNTMQTEKNLRIQNLEDDLSLLRLQHDNMTKDYSYLLLQNKDINSRLTKTTEERDLLLIKISQLQSQISQSNLTENNKMKTNNQLQNEILELRADFNELLKDRDYWRDCYEKYKIESDRQFLNNKENYELAIREKNSLNEQVVKLVKERNDLILQLESLKNINKKHEEEVRLSLISFKVLEKDKKELELQNSNQLEQINLLLSEKEKYITQINQYNIQIQNSDISGKNYLINLEKVKKERDDLMLSLDHSRLELNNQKTELLKNQDRIKQLENEKLILNEKLIKLNLEKDSLNTLVENKVNELKLKNEEILNYGAQIRKLELERTKNLEQIESLSRESLNMKTAFDNLKTEKEELNSKLNFNLSENKRLNDNLSVMESRLNNLDKEYKKLDEELNLKNKMFVDLTRDFEKYKIDNMLKLDAFYNLQKRFDEVKRLHNIDMEKLRLLQINFSTLQNQKNKLEVDFEKMNGLVCSSTDENEEHQRNLALMEQKLDEFASKNNNLESKLKIYMSKDSENTTKISLYEIRQNENLKLISEYESLLRELKLQINNNQNLISLARELNYKLDLQNQKISNDDGEIKRLIVLLQEKKNKSENEITDRIDRAYLDKNEKDVNSLKKRIADLELRGQSINIITTSVNGNY